jgi:alkylmercury lyase
MQQLTKKKLIEEYQAAYNAIPQEALELDLRVTIKTMQALAEGDPVSPAQLANMWEMPLDQVRAILEQAKVNGQVEINTRGDLVGAVLSLNPTIHQISIDDKLLYAWCAYDAIYAPGVIGRPVQIVSQDPVTGEAVRMTITPAGVENVQPESTVVSVVGAEMDMRAGPEGPRCTQMLFFGSKDSAKQWLQNRVGVSILTVEEVFEIASRFQIEPARRLGLV